MKQIEHFHIHRSTGFKLQKDYDSRIQFQR